MRKSLTVAFLLALVACGELPDIFLPDLPGLFELSGAYDLPIGEWPSPNQDSRPDGMKIDTLVIHHTAGLGDAEEVAKFFQNPKRRVSSHYVIGRDGQIIRCVPDAARAWHAGVSEWRGRTQVNDFSIGIELCNLGDGQEPFTDALYQSLIALSREILARYPIQPQDITGHRDVARPVGRKQDPADNFDWQRYRRGLYGAHRHGPSALFR